MQGDCITHPIDFLTFTNGLPQFSANSFTNEYNLNGSRCPDEGSVTMKTMCPNHESHPEPCPELVEGLSKDHVVHTLRKASS